MVDLNLDDILMTSTRLTDLGTVYKGIVGDIKTVSTSEADLFETGGPQAAYTKAMGTLWDYCADTQDNLNICSSVLVRYINAVCAEDEGAAQDLKTQSDALNNALDLQEEQNGLDHGELGSRVPGVDPNADDGTVVDEPKYDKADQPPEEN